LARKYSVFLLGYEKACGGIAMVSDKSIACAFAIFVFHEKMLSL